MKGGVDALPCIVPDASAGATPVECINILSSGDSLSPSDGDCRPVSSQPSGQFSNSPNEGGEVTKDLYIHDKITNALDDRDTGEVTIAGIEHMVFPVLQKEMVQRKKDLKVRTAGPRAPPAGGASPRRSPRSSTLSPPSATPPPVRALQSAVLVYARDPDRRRRDPQGLRLAAESAGHLA